MFLAPLFYRGFIYLLFRIGPGLLPRIIYNFFSHNTCCIKLSISIKTGKASSTIMNSKCCFWILFEKKGYKKPFWSRRYFGSLKGKGRIVKVTQKLNMKDKIHSIFYRVSQKGTKQLTRDFLLNIRQLVIQSLKVEIKNVFSAMRWEFFKLDS